MSILHTWITFITLLVLLSWVRGSKSRYGTAQENRVKEFIKADLKIQNEQLGSRALSDLLKGQETVFSAEEYNISKVPATRLAYVTDYGKEISSESLERQDEREQEFLKAEGQGIERDKNEENPYIRPTILIAYPNISQSEGEFPAVEQELALKIGEVLPESHRLNGSSGTDEISNETSSLNQDSEPFNNSADSEVNLNNTDNTANKTIESDSDSKYQNNSTEAQPQPVASPSEAETGSEKTNSTKASKIADDRELSTSDSLKNDTSRILGVIIIVQWRLHHWYSVLCFSGIAIAILLAINLANFISNQLNSDLLKALDGIFRDVMILIGVAIMVRVLDHYNLLQFMKYYGNVELLSISCLIFILLWASLGAVLILIAHYHIKQWRTYESEYHKREHIYRQYETLYYNTERTRQLDSQLKYLSNQLEFLLIRQEFISPSVLPIMGEDFLRDDFDFASYLTKCLSKVNRQAFRYDFATLLALTTACGLSILAHYYIGTPFVKILILVPGILFILLVITASKLNSIYLQLITAVQSPYDIALTKFENLRQPLIDIEQLNMPGFINNPMSKVQYQRTYPRLQKPNRHLLLFWLSSPNYTTRLLHILIVLHVAWLTYFILTLSYGLESLSTNYLIAFGVSSFVFLLNLLYILPKILKLLAIVKNIQMLKDSELRSQVVEDKMAQRTKVMYSIYSILKTVHRQSVPPEESNRLRLFTIDYLREAFRDLRGDEEGHKIFSGQLMTLGYLCGRKLSSHELMILAHDITSKAAGDINFEDFLEAVEKISEDVKVNPVELSKAAIKELINSNSSKISARNLRAVIEQLHLVEDCEVEALLHEVKYLPIQNAEHSLELISTLIRDTIEGMPR